jgi:hypothetical protein
MDRAGANGRAAVNQSTVLVGGALTMFVLYLAAKGRFGQYLGLIWPRATAGQSGPTAPAAPAAAGVVPGTLAPVAAGSPSWLGLPNIAPGSILSGIASSVGAAGGFGSALPGLIP